MKKIWILVLLVFFIVTSLCLAINKGVEQYTYDTRNPPKIWFFPVKDAKWDGAKVTVKEWNVLTDEQKRKYVEEYIAMAIETLRDDYIIMEDINPDYHLMALEIFRSRVSDPSVEMQTIVLTSLIANGDIEKRPNISKNK
ncbi:MAG: hypothetical protein PHQ52_04365 [Candidatus Omnitrophica bacterium]|nr:hypothetical protein [Candidatus Omnitrophota bacterium]